MNSTEKTYIGLVVHKLSISVAIASGFQRGKGEPRYWGTLPNAPEQIRRLVNKLEANNGSFDICYEAGSCGYGLYRQLIELGH